jgi:hypothetical protein
MHKIFWYLLSKITKLQVTPFFIKCSSLPTGIANIFPDTITFYLKNEILQVRSLFSYCPKYKTLGDKLTVMKIVVS